MKPNKIEKIEEDILAELKKLSKQRNKNKELDEFLANDNMSDFENK